MVVVMAWVVYSTNSGVGLYILVTTLFSVIQYVIQYRQLVRAKWQARGIAGKK
jgi:membrane protein insertase Oxa1/YidC/SpoIIIJ